MLLDTYINSGTYAEKLTEIAKEGPEKLIGLINDGNVQALFKKDARYIRAWLSQFSTVADKTAGEVTLRIPADKESQLPEKWDGKTLLFWVDHSLYCKYRAFSNQTESQHTLQITINDDIKDMATEIQLLLTLGCEFQYESAAVAEV